MSDATQSIDDILDQSGLQLSQEDRERLVRIYPIVRSWAEPLRLVEARYAEPALIYQVDDLR